MSTQEVTVVTGGNRGLGFEVCRQLARHGARVVLTARRAADAERAAAELRDQRLDVWPLALDVSDVESLSLFDSQLGPVSLGALVNNAAVSLNGFDAIVAQKTLDVNFCGIVALTDRMLPRLAPAARVVMVSSGMGELSCLSRDLALRFAAPTLDRAQLFELMRSFVAAVARGEHAQDGWPSNAYSVSKVGLNAFTRVLARELAGTDVRVNAVNPGWVRTRMGGSGAPRSVEDGARGIVAAALLDPAGRRGEFLRDGHPVPW